jgi:hypothetical protein
LPGNNPMNTAQRRRSGDISAACSRQPRRGALRRRTGGGRARRPLKGGSAVCSRRRGRQRAERRPRRLAQAVPGQRPGPDRQLVGQHRPEPGHSESDLAKSIGSDDIDTLAQHTGLPRDECSRACAANCPPRSTN